MYNTILVPLDGSERAEAIIPHVENLAKYDEAKVVFTRVVEPISRSFVLDPDAPPQYKFDSAAADEAKAYLKQWQTTFEDRGVESDSLLMYGYPVDSILHAANEAKADLIALSSQGRTGLAQVFYGSTASGVLNRVRRPLLMVHTATTEAMATNRNILVPMDGSKRSEAIMPHVEGVAKLYEAEITLLRVVVTTHDTTTFDDLEEDIPEKEVHGHLLNRLGQEQEVERYKNARTHLLKWRDYLRDEGYNAKALLMHGRPVEGIAQAAEELNVDLIAMTNKGKTGLAQVFYGSVTIGVLNRVMRPILVMRPDI